MSYDIHLEIDAGGEEPVPVTDGMNITWNVGGFFRAVLGGDGLNGLDGMSGADARDALRRAVDKARDLYYAKALPPEPENGWGSNFGALAFLALLLADCERAPRAVVRVQ